MNPEETDGRMAAIEARLARLEALLPAAQTPPAAKTPVPAPATPARENPRPAAAAKPRGDSPLAGNILGWGGALALVLAASYLIRLAIDSGWLTPLRQVAAAAVFGLVLIGSGFALRRQNREYAGLLPAAGVAILFLAIYGGHLYHHIVGVRDAAIGVMIVCAASLWLCRAFQSDLYALFAVAGSYSAPFLLSRAAGSLADLAIYFSAWGVVFCIFSVWHGRRLIYLLALYLALIGFDVIWRGQQDEWVAVMVFQAVQFALFGATTAIFSIRRQAPLDTGRAIMHLPPLLLFYFLEYSLLKEHLPALAPWIAVGSLAAMGALYAVARSMLQRPLPGGELLLWCYAALVLFHAGYVESVPGEWAPWVALLLVPIVALITLRGEGGLGARWPIWVAVGIIFALNYLRIVFHADVQPVPGRQFLSVAYALLLYAGYWFCRGRKSLSAISALMLYLGHISAMAAAARLLDEPIVESAAWGLLAIGCLLLSLRLTDKLLGQSALAMFAATAAKVLLYDLSGASPVARIIGLVVLGLSFYFGGLLYQRLVRESANGHAPAN